MSSQTITIPPRFWKRQAFYEWCLENAPTFASWMVHVPHGQRRCNRLAAVLLAVAERTVAPAVAESPRDVAIRKLREDLDALSKVKP